MPQFPTELTFLGNGPVQWAIAAAVFVVVGLFVRVALKVLLGRMEALARRTQTDLDDLVAELVRKTKNVFVLIVAFWLASQTLVLSDATDQRIGRLVAIALVVQMAFWGTGIAAHLIDRYRRRQLEIDPSAATAIGAMAFIARVAVWSIAGLVILDNLGIDITALVTGLGIGGVAVALALQNVLSDLFASLSIVLDKPFVVGDFVVVGDFLGTVEYVGLKTTRLRSLSGEQIVFSNSDLLGSRIRNFKRMAERRALFQIGVTYDTPEEKLRKIPGMIREAIEARDNTRFDRAHFKTYGPSSLDFETVYYVLVPEYNAYMDVQQEINFEILRRFTAEGIEFAYPTQTLYLARA